MNHDEKLPTAHDVRRLLHRTNWTVAIGVVAIGIVCVIAAMYAASGRAASQDSANATKVQLASQGRDACITERRNAQNDAAGRISISANEAEVAGLVNNDEAEALRQLAIFQRAVKDWKKATDSLSPEVLNLPVDKGGCGPPVLTLDDLKRAEGG